MFTNLEQIAQNMFLRSKGCFLGVSSRKKNCFVLGVNDAKRLYFHKLWSIVYIPEQTTRQDQLRIERYRMHKIGK